VPPCLRVSVVNLKIHNENCWLRILVTWLLMKIVVNQWYYWNTSH